MTSKILSFIVILLFFLLIWLYFLFHPSYERSIEAKYHYEMGHYKEAYTLANEAFAMDVYNRMAATIMAQSLTSLKYVEYISLAQKYMVQIEEILKMEYIDEAKRAKIRLMSEVMVDSYKKLAPSIITDEDLVEEAAMHHSNFEKFLEQVNR